MQTQIRLKLLYYFHIQFEKDESSIFSLNKNHVKIRKRKQSQS